MNQIIKNTIILFVITLVAGICLGTVHDITLIRLHRHRRQQLLKLIRKFTRMRQALMKLQELADAVTAAATASLSGDLEKLPSMMQKKRWMQAATRSVT